jgi:hypothetical protein
MTVISGVDYFFGVRRKVEEERRRRAAVKRREPRATRAS